MMTTTGDSPHLSDAQMMQIVDADEHDDAVAEHVGACAACTRDLDQLRADAALIGDWLGRAAFEQGTARAAGPGQVTSAAIVRLRPWHSRAWLRAAAVLLVLAAPVAALPGLRSWLVDSIDPAGSEMAAPMADPATAAGVSIRFVPGQPTLTVTFDVVPAAGHLVLRYASGAEAVFDVDDTAGGGPIVSEAGIRVVNGGSARSSYTLSVPATVTAVTVRVGARAGITVDSAALRAGTELSIGPR